MLFSVHIGVFQCFVADHRKFVCIVAVLLEILRLQRCRSLFIGKYGEVYVEPCFVRFRTVSGAVSDAERLLIYVLNALDLQQIDEIRHFVLFQIGFHLSVILIICQTVVIVIDFLRLAGVGDAHVYRDNARYGCSIDAVCRLGGFIGVHFPIAGKDVQAYIFQAGGIRPGKLNFERERLLLQRIICTAPAWVGIIENGTLLSTGNRVIHIDLGNVHRSLGVKAGHMFGFVVQTAAGNYGIDLVKGVPGRGGQGNRGIPIAGTVGGCGSCFLAIVVDRDHTVRQCGAGYADILVARLAGHGNSGGHRLCCNGSNRLTAALQRQDRCETVGSRFTCSHIETNRAAITGDGNGDGVSAARII